MPAGAAGEEHDPVDLGQVDAEVGLDQLAVTIRLASRSASTVGCSAISLAMKLS